MTENPDKLVLKHLRAIREDVAAMKHDIAEIKTTQAAMLQLIKRRLEMREETAE